VSLISDALKEAQRERSERVAPRGSPSLGDSFFPHPGSAKRQAPSRWLIVGIGSAVVLAIAGAGVARVVLNKKAVRQSVIAKTRILNSHPTPVVTASPIPAATVAAVDTTPVVTAPKAPAAKPEPHIDQQPRQIVAAARPVTAPVASNPKPASLVDSTVTAPAPGLPSTQVAGVRESGVRVIVDPVGLRPGDSLFARAFAEHMRGNLDGAADLYEKALLKPPVAPDLYNDYGALLAARGSHPAAIAMYRTGIEKKGEDPKLWINLADSYKAIGRHADALSSYFQAAKLDPLNAIVRMRLAGEYQAIGDTASARRGYEEAIRVAPKEPDVHYNYGAFLQSQRDYAGAVRELQAFVDLAPGRVSQDFIERTKGYISNLRRQYP
jgi:Flp pilus assembly protein TadD